MLIYVSAELDEEHKVWQQTQLVNQVAAWASILARDVVSSVSQ
jgi:hypothetical protein